MKSPKYTCSECGLPVVVMNGQPPIRSCVHTGAIIAHMCAVLEFDGGLLPPPKKES